MAEPTRMIIDTDPGIDDTAAILMALGSPELQIEALITVFGNTPIERCTTNALRILEAAGRSDIPVYEGAGRQYNFDVPHYAAHVHGDDGMGDVGLAEPKGSAKPGYGVMEIIERILASPGEITFMSIGRQTNLALAMSIEPRIAEAIKEVVVMGGAIYQPGNATPVATANIYGDPEATDVVYRSGAKIVQIGLDVCHKVEISGDQQKRVWDAGTSASEIMQKTTQFISDAYRRSGRLMNSDGVQYNDVPALAYSIKPELFECSDLYVRIETQGALTRGQTVADLRGRAGVEPNVRVALDVDAAGVTELWTERVAGIKP